MIERLSCKQGVVGLNPTNGTTKNMSNNHIAPKKHFGQNFLTDQNILRKIIEYSRSDMFPTIIEIGGGLGALSKLIVKLNNNLQKLYIIEKDIRFKETLDNIDSKVIVFIEDALKFNFTSLGLKDFIIVGNLPYNIATLIIIRLLKMVRPSSMSFLVQKEVAERICATVGSKEYGRLSVFIQSIANVNLGFQVSPNVFFPKPKVISQTIQFTNINYDEKLIEKLEIITNKLFSHSRKKIGKMLDTLNIRAESNIRNLRAENISVAQYIEFAKQLI